MNNIEKVNFEESNRTVERNVEIFSLLGTLPSFWSQVEVSLEVLPMKSILFSVKP